MLKTDLERLVETQKLTIEDKDREISKEKKVSEAYKLETEDLKKEYEAYKNKMESKPTESAPDYTSIIKNYEEQNKLIVDKYNLAMKTANSYKNALTGILQTMQGALSNTIELDLYLANAFENAKIKQ